MLHVHIDSPDERRDLAMCGSSPGPCDRLRAQGRGTYVRRNVAAEFSILGAIENSAPRFESPNAVRRFLRVQLSHAPLIHILTAAHCIGEMHLPVIAFINIGQGRRDSASAITGVRFARSDLQTSSTLHLQPTLR